jgi:hypothetical protein
MFEVPIDKTGEGSAGRRRGSRAATFPRSNCDGGIIYGL